jgi:hypothetical protein
MMGELERIEDQLRRGLERVAWHTTRRVGTWQLARYMVAIVEGSIMLTRTRRDR